MYPDLFGRAGHADRIKIGKYPNKKHPMPMGQGESSTNFAWSLSDLKDLTAKFPAHKKTPSNTKYCNFPFRNLSEKRFSRKRESKFSFFEKWMLTMFTFYSGTKGVKPPKSFHTR